MITTPISPTNVLKRSSTPSPSSSSSNSTNNNNGIRKTPQSRTSNKTPHPSPPPSLMSSTSIPTMMTPTDNLPTHFKGPVTMPNPFPFFPMNGMTAVPNPMMNMYAMNGMGHPLHMPPTNPSMFGMFPQPMIPPPTNQSHIHPIHPHQQQQPINVVPIKTNPPIQPKPSTVPLTPTTHHQLKPKATKKKKKSSTNNNSSPNSGVTTSKTSPKRKPPSTSQSIHEHIISYLLELGLNDSAKILEKDLSNPLLMNVSHDRISGFVHSLTNEVEKHSHLLPPTKKVPNSNENIISTFNQQVEKPTMLPSNPETNFNDITVKTEIIDINNNEYKPDEFLDILKKSTTYNSATAEYVNERLENLEQTLGIKEQKDEVFSRIKDVEEKMLLMDVSKEVEPEELCSPDIFNSDFFSDVNDNIMQENDNTESYDSFIFDL